jgi:hypothetical protein
MNDYKKRGFVVPPEQREKADTSLKPPSYEFCHTTVYRPTAVSRLKTNRAEIPGTPWYNRTT